MNDSSGHTLTTRPRARAYQPLVVVLAAVCRRHRGRSRAAPLRSAGGGRWRCVAWLGWWLAWRRRRHRRGRGRCSLVQRGLGRRRLASLPLVALPRRRASGCLPRETAAPAALEAAAPPAGSPAFRRRRPIRCARSPRPSARGWRWKCWRCAMTTPGGRPAAASTLIVDGHLLDVGRAIACASLRNCAAATAAQSGRVRFRGAGPRCAAAVLVAQPSFPSA